MESTYNWAWVESAVSAAIADWNTCARSSSLKGSPNGPWIDLRIGLRFSPREQESREAAYDDALLAVEREAKLARHGPRERQEAQRRIVAVFPRFASLALGLEDQAIHLLTEGFLPIGTQFAQWATRFDPDLSTADTIQACRNAWTVCGIQPLLGDPMRMTPAIIGYSLLYPYSDNYLDSGKILKERKLEFSARFRDRLCGLDITPGDRHEAAVWAMVRLIEDQFPRTRFPRVYESLLAIHQAQEDSMAQSKRGRALSEAELLRLSCAKGGASVLADACLSHGFLSNEEARFAFQWGVLLQFGDDLQDVQDDLEHGAATMFSRAAAAGVPLDHLVRQLLQFSEHVADQIERLPHGDPALKRLLRMSWRSLILMAVAKSHRYFTSEFLAELEPVSSFRFGFLRARHKRLSGRRGLYKVLFDSFLRFENVDLTHLPRPEDWLPFTQHPNYSHPAQAVAGSLA